MIATPPWLAVVVALVAVGCGRAASRPPDVEAMAFVGPPAPAAEPEAAPVPAPPATPSLRPATRLERVEIESASGATRVVLDLDGFVEPEVSLWANRRLVLDLPGTTCSTVPKVIEVTDPVVERIRTGEPKPPEVKARVVLDLHRRADFTVRAEGDRLIVALTTEGMGETANAPEAPAPPEPARPTAEGSPPSSAASPETGDKRISVDFVDTDVRTVIDLLAGLGGYQVIFTPAVTGNVSVRMIERPWEDALETVLRKRRLREVRHEDLMLVTPR